MSDISSVGFALMCCADDYFAVLTLLRGGWCACVQPSHLQQLQQRRVDPPSSPLSPLLLLTPSLRKKTQTLLQVCVGDSWVVHEWKWLSSCFSPCRQIWAVSRSFYEHLDASCATLVSSWNSLSAAASPGVRAGGSQPGCLDGVSGTSATGLVDLLRHSIFFFYICLCR